MFAAVFRSAAAPAVAATRILCPWSQKSVANTNFLKVLPTLAGFSRSFSDKRGDIHGLTSQVCAVLGAQWGDEGKGKLVDILAQKYDIVARFNGGANAGHTLKVDGKKFAFHLLPCGMLYKDKINVIGNGVVLHVPTLFKELDNLKANGLPINGLRISDRAHLLFDFHMVIDGKQETARGGTAIGTTKRGIGPCYTSKTTRSGIRVGELFNDWEHFSQRHAALCKELQAQFGFEYDIAEEQKRFKAYREQLRPMVIDGVHYLNSALRSGKRVLAEGANAALLDLDFGTYPYVTSSSTSAGGVCTGLGIAPNKIQCHIGIVKAYTTRVGAGPFPTELEDANGQHMRAVGVEFGTTTGRPRRCGWLDIPVLHYSNYLNGYNSINITKLDVLTGLKELKIGVSYSIDGKKLDQGQMPATLIELAKVKVDYETLPGWTQDISKCKSANELPKEAKAYVKRVEDLTGLPVSWIGVGPGREAMLQHN